MPPCILAQWMLDHRHSEYAKSLLSGAPGFVKYTIKKYRLTAACDCQLGDAEVTIFYRF
jgi:hypothetical protein